MGEHTKRTHRVLLLWLELQRAMRSGGQAGVLPWESGNTDVARIWEQITEPLNQRVLEEWLYQSVEGQQAEWARKALQTCRERKAEG